MSVMISEALLEQQVELARAVLELQRGMKQHLASRVLPHLGVGGLEIVQGLVDIFDGADALDPNLADHLDAAIAEIRAEIHAGTGEHRVALPREQLIGCREAFETRKVLSPQAGALADALPPIEALHGAARQALDFAAAVRLGRRLLLQD